MIMGSCKRCGLCCEQGYRFHYKGNALTREEETGCVIDIDQLEFRRVDPIDPTQPPCGRLVYDIDTHLARCTVQGTSKSTICREYPQWKEEMVFPECGFSWVPLSVEVGGDQHA